MAHLRRSNRGEISCPQAGCQARVSKDTLERDIEAELAVKRAQRQQQNSQSMEEEDIIDL
jgi:hypothetical protein